MKTGTLAYEFYFQTPLTAPPHRPPLSILAELRMSAEPSDLERLMPAEATRLDEGAWRGCTGRARWEVRSRVWDTKRCDKMK